MAEPEWYFDIEPRPRRRRPAPTPPPGIELADESLSPYDPEAFPMLRTEAPGIAPMELDDPATAVSPSPVVTEVRQRRIAESEAERASRRADEEIAAYREAVADQRTRDQLRDMGPSLALASGVPLLPEIAAAGSAAGRALGIGDGDDLESAPLSPEARERARRAWDEGFRGERPEREEGYRADVARNRALLTEAAQQNPEAAIAGTTAAMLATGGIGGAPLAGLRGTQLAGQIARNAAPFAGAGAALGGVGGYLGSEGEEGGQRLRETLEGAATGGAVGAGVSGLGQLGAAARALPVARGAGRSLATGAGILAGGAAEGTGYGAGVRALYGDETVTEDGYLPGVFTPTTLDVAGGAIGAAAGRGVEGVRRAFTPTRTAEGATLPEAMSDAPLNVDEEIAAVFAERADDVAPGIDVEGAGWSGYQAPDVSVLPEEPGFLDRILRGAPSRDADVTRLEAAGLTRAADRRRAVRAFGSVRAAADALRESGISARQSLGSVDDARARAEIVRPASGGALGSAHRYLERRGTVSPGNQVADDLEALAAEYDYPTASPALRARAERLRADAERARYGEATPEAAEIARLRAAPTVEATPLDTEAADLLAGGPEVTAYPPRQMVPPRLIPFAEVRRNLTDLAATEAGIRQGRVAAPSLADDIARERYRAWANARNTAAERDLGPEQMAEYRQANRAFRAGNLVAPIDQMAPVDATAPHTLSSRMAMAAGGVMGGIPGVIAGWRLGAELPRYERAILASMAEGGLTSPTVARTTTATLARDAARQARMLLTPQTRRTLERAAAGEAVDPRMLMEAVDDVTQRLPQESRQRMSIARNELASVEAWPVVMQQFVEAARAAPGRISRASDVIGQLYQAGRLTAAQRDAASSNPQLMAAIDAAIADRLREDDEPEDVETAIQRDQAIYGGQAPPSFGPAEDGEEPMTEEEREEEIRREQEAYSGRRSP